MPSPRSERAVGEICEHVARRIHCLQEETRSPLLIWRNRNLRTVYWGIRLFHRLCPDLLVKGKTRYFDYHLAAMDEYEGAVNLRFESRKRTVLLRLALAETLDRDPVLRWEPIALAVQEDERTADERLDAAHRVEAFVGYLLSRNLPPAFSLDFDRGDPPAGHMPAEFNVDLLDVVPPDDSSWFYMIMGSQPEVAVATCCDRECFNLFSFVSSPPASSAVSAPWVGAPSADLFRHIFQSSLKGDYALMGGDRPAQCLDAIRSLPRPPRLVILIDSCLSRLIGEDITGAAEAFRRQTRIPLVLYEIKLVRESYLAQVSGFWRDVYAALGEGDRAPRPGRVCLFGIELDSAGELARHLRAMGLQMLGPVFPRFSLDDIRDLGSASLAVVNTWHCTRTMFTDLLQELGRAVIDLAPGWTGARRLAERVGADHLPTALPLGIGGTVDWVRSIARPLGVEDAAERFLDRELAALAPRLEWILPRFCFGKSVMVFADRITLGPLAAFFEELGLQIAAVGSTSGDFAQSASEGSSPAGRHPRAPRLLAELQDFIVQMRQRGELELIGDPQTLRARYDVILFDVLGDVVCGGFSAPMRSGYGDEVYIVTSGEFRSLYAANNISQAVRHYSRNGVRLGGLIANLRGLEREAERVEQLAGSIGTRVVHAIPQDREVARAELERIPVVDGNPSCAAAVALRELGAKIAALAPADLAVPRPLPRGELDRMFLSRS